MSDGSSSRVGTYDKGGYLEHASFPASLSPLEVVAKFWDEVRKLVPATELHVVDPYLLDAGGLDPATYAGHVATLLKPALADAQRVVLVYDKAREGTRELLERYFGLINKDASLAFIRGSQMHGRYIIGDRCQVLRMEFSFNRIGMTFGTVSVVDDAEDRTGILHELKRLLAATGP